MSAERLVIIGDGIALRLAESIAAKSAFGSLLRVERLRPEHIAGSRLEVLGHDDPSEVWVFAAIGADALNYARSDLCATLESKHYRLASLVDPTAIAEETAIVEQNCLIGAGVYVAPGATIGRGTMLLPTSCVGADSSLGAFVWLASQSSVGAQAAIGSHVVVAEGVHVADRARVGANCEIAIPGRYDRELAEGTFISSSFDGPVRLYRSV